MSDLAEAIQRCVDEYIKEKIDAVDNLTLTIAFGGSEPMLHFYPDRPPEHELEVTKPLRKALLEELERLEEEEKELEFGEDEPRKSALVRQLVKTIDEWRQEEKQR